MRQQCAAYRAFQQNLKEWRQVAAALLQRYTLHRATGRGYEGARRISEGAYGYKLLVLRNIQMDEPKRKRWARHGSTRWLWKPQHVSAAIQYVIAEQGDAVSVFEYHETQSQCAASTP